MGIHDHRHCYNDLMVMMLRAGGGGCCLLVAVAVLSLKHLDVVGLLATLLRQHQGRQHTEKETGDTARKNKKR